LIRIHRIERVGDSSEVAGARRAASECAATLRMSETATGNAALLATELATNLIKHAGGGSMLFGVDESRPQTLTITAIDKGRGMNNVAAAMQDGYSTAGSQGTGLGAVERRATSFDIYTMADKGTVIHCTIADEAPRPSPFDVQPRISIAGLSLPKPGETAFGDSWIAMRGNDSITVAVADGLGHGPAAATASAAAVRIFSGGAEQPLEQLMQDAHGALRPTRGAAVGIARIHPQQRRVDFIGAGNIAGTIADDEGMRKTVSLPGIVGHEMRKLQTFSYPWTASSVLILHSDGLSASWASKSYPGLLQHEAALIAAVLYRDHCRGNDDATVVAAKAS
jgi:anti-sigma regulatory factor (Ser/Thr protein kinase)